MSEINLEAELERHHAVAFGWARCCCPGARELAEDVLQAAYLKVLGGGARFDGRSTFRTWLFGVIRRTAAEQRRRALVSRLMGLRWLGQQDERAVPTPADDLERTESAARVRGALERLSARQRSILHLVFYQDLSVSEAAGVLGISVGTARRHYDRGKARLRTLLAESNGERFERSRNSRPVPAA